MTTTSFTQFGSLLIGPLETRDAQRYGDDAVGEILSDFEAGGLLPPGDLSRLKAILQKYFGGSVGATNRLGSTSSTDAADAGRQAALRVRANLAHNQSVASGYRDFWDKRNEELAASIRR
jgi:hypothetical protein